MLTFAGQSVKDVDALYRLLTAERISQAVAVEILRGYEKVELTVRPTEAT